MTWKNAFDVGECTVNVYYGVSRVYQAVMHKGDSQSFLVSGSNSTISVSVDGAVLLDGPSLTGNVSVVVFLAVTGPECRARQITAAGVITTVRGATEEGSGVNLTGGGSAWTPDPCITAADSRGVDITTSPGGGG